MTLVRIYGKNKAGKEVLLAEVVNCPSEYISAKEWKIWREGYTDFRTETLREVA